MNAASDVNIDFEIDANGWGRCHVQIQGTVFALSGISDSTDALGDLIRASVLIASGGRRAVVSFDREPLEWRLILTVPWDDDATNAQIEVRVLELEDFHAELPDSAGYEVFMAICGADAFARAVEVAARRILEKYGRVGYQTAWNQPFPARAYAALKAALES